MALDPARASVAAFGQEAHQGKSGSVAHIFMLIGWWGPKRVDTPRFPFDPIVADGAHQITQNE